MGSHACAVLLEGLSKKFGSQKVVDSLDLQVPPGCIHGIIGPNGSGKTTTIRMILRIFKPDAGVVHVLGRPSGDAADEGLVHRCTRSRGGNNIGCRDRHGDWGRGSGL